MQCKWVPGAQEIVLKKQNPKAEQWDIHTEWMREKESLHVSARTEASLLIPLNLISFLEKERYLEKWRYSVHP